MKTLRFTLGSLLFTAFFASVSHAQSTFVSTSGNDFNPCTRTAPCRTFATASAATPLGGEVVVLDSGDYDAFTITRSVSIVAPAGVHAGIPVASGNGINVATFGPATVVLRGLTITNQGSFGDGIEFTNGTALRVENCVVNGFSGGNGLLQSSPNSHMVLKDSVFRDNSEAIRVWPASGAAQATVEQVRMEGGSIGLLAGPASRVTVRNSVGANTSGAGFFAFSFGPAARAELNIETCLATDNGGVGIEGSGSSGSTTIRVSNSTVTGNGIGLLNFISSAVILSRGNNTVQGNTTDVVGPIGTYPAS